MAGGLSVGAQRRIAPAAAATVRDRQDGGIVNVVLDGLSNAAYWRLFCKASAHGRSVADDIVAALNAESAEIPPDAEARLAAARHIRQLIAAQSGTP